MKKSVILILLFFIAFNSKAVPVYIFGQVLDSTGTGVPNKQVKIDIQQSSIWSSFAMDTSDVNGNFFALGNVVDTLGQFRFLVFDCFGDSVIWNESFNTNITDSVITSINICTNTSPQCAASFNYSVQAPFSVQFTGIYTPQPSTFSTFSWDFGDGMGTSIQQNPSYQYNSPGDYQVCLTYSDSNLICNVTFCDSINIQSNPVCALDFSFESYGSAISFSGTDSNSTPLSAYSWNFGDGNTANGLNAINNFSNPGLYNVCLEKIDSINPCIYCDSVLVSYDTSLLSLSGTIGVNSLNRSGDLVIVYEETNTGSAPFIQAFDTTLTSNGNYIFHGLTSDIYSIRVIPNNISNDPGLMPKYWQDANYWGNASSILLSSNLQGIDLNFTFNPNNLSGPGSVVVSIRDSINQHIDNAIVWIEDLNQNILQYDISDMTSNVHFNNLPFGDYKVGTDLPGYYMFKEDVILNSTTPTDSIGLNLRGAWLATSLSRNNREERVNIFPNPTTGEFYLKHNLEEFVLDLRNIEGKKIDIEVENSNNTAKIDLKEFPGKGVYILQIITDEKIICKKLFVR